MILDRKISEVESELREPVKELRLVEMERRKTQVKGLRVMKVLELAERRHLEHKAPKLISDLHASLGLSLTGEEEKGTSTDGVSGNAGKRIVPTKRYGGGQTRGHGGVERCSKCGKPNGWMA